jgi:hypothetical protein
MADAVIEGIRERVASAIQVNQSVGIQVPENRHGDLLEAVFDSMCRNTHDIWTFVTVSKTFDYLSKIFKEGTLNSSSASPVLLGSLIPPRTALSLKVR